MRRALAVGFVQIAPLPPTPEMLAVAVDNAASPVSLASRSEFPGRSANGRTAEGTPPPGWFAANLRMAGITRRLYVSDGRPSLFRSLVAGTDGSVAEIRTKAGPPSAWSLADLQAGLAVIEIPPVADPTEIRQLLDQMAARFDGLWILGLSPGPGSLFPCARWYPSHPGGVLFSASTRTAGLLVPADLTADLAAFSPIW